MLIGKRISGRYQILRVIGGGGMANVYLAEDMILDREVAIKILRFDFASDDDFIRRFRREAQSAASLDHPNIVSIYDVGEEDDIYYIVMEYVEGMTLKEYIHTNGPLHPKEAVRIMEQVVAAMEEAHAKQLVHRDIKPHNILIDNMGNIKVTDFGIAMALSSATITHTNSVLGSVHYLSPEQARGGLATKKSDIYSLGIVLYELISGRMPFEGESAVSVALKHLQSEPPSVRRWNPSVPQSVENIILKAMAKDPFYRYEDASEMQKDLKTAFDPARLKEKRFVIEEDHEATKAIPIMKDHQVDQDHEKTAIHPVQKPKKKEKQKPKKKRKKWPWIVASIFFILTTATILAITVFPGFLFPKDIEVTDVSGMTVEKAEDTLKKAGFTVAADPIEIADNEIEKGLVVKTDPNIGTKVKEGTEIQLYESTGKEKTELPDVTGEKVEKAKEILEKKGFKQVVVEEVNDNDTESGIVMEQQPSASTELVAADEEVTLTVSLGPADITLRDLTTYSKQAASNYLEDNGLKLDEKEAYSDDVPKGEVVKQEPEAGTAVKPGDTVKITFSLGPKAKPAKTVTEKISIPYEPETEGQEMNVQISIDDAEHSISDLYETFKITAPTERTIKFKIEPGQKGYYQVTVDDKVVSSKTIEYPDDE
ncbi:serine/threonine protein kinase [Bacillus xiamenensis]|uniref:non-specific serine/threonine protein kinase n=1 Tax=Bacillus xiamenensis TaxID=1178537 RepID=A0ABT4EYJ3_9BACI|nr:Stk1 family PASTA domain-containing Ser/Thr kinase [Bacillus xiamenensis]MBG9912599.1 serine/threonine protein kinase [Bacillus xiamenensis]MCY9574842.1 Stk1 family PASTA domain-containing Ser/Thr kinase [Bacillus xiamenensis]